MMPMYGQMMAIFDGLQLILFVLSVLLLLAEIVVLRKGKGLSPMVSLLLITGAGGCRRYRAGRLLAGWCAGQRLQPDGERVWFAAGSGDACCRIFRDGCQPGAYPELADREVWQGLIGK